MDLASLSHPPVSLQPSGPPFHGGLALADVPARGACSFPLTDGGNTEPRNGETEVTGSRPPAATSLQAQGTGVDPPDPPMTDWAAWQDRQDSVPAGPCHSSQPGALPDSDPASLMVAGTEGNGGVGHAHVGDEHAVGSSGSRKRPAPDQDAGTDGATTATAAEYVFRAEHGQAAASEAAASAAEANGLREGSIDAKEIPPEPEWGPGHALPPVDSLEARLQQASPTLHEQEEQRLQDQPQQQQQQVVQGDVQMQEADGGTARGAPADSNSAEQTPELVGDASNGPVGAAGTAASQSAAATAAEGPGGTPASATADQPASLVVQDVLGKELTQIISPTGGVSNAAYASRLGALVDGEGRLGGRLTLLTVLQQSSQEVLRTLVQVRACRCLEDAALLWLRTL